jgi:MFS family permease
MPLFYTCFIALVTTAFGFILRAIVLADWGREFGLSQTQLGEIAGVGLWPFAISIVLFSLIIDRVGYKTSLAVAFACHLVSAALTIWASGYWMLYIGTFIMAIGNGIVEAVVNPVVATMFPQQKTKWLNYLHAAWPGGLVLGGMMALLLGEGARWEFKIGLIMIPTLLYGVMMLSRKFPLNERVSAGVSYYHMLKEVGGFGALVIVSLIVFQLGAVFGWSAYLSLVLTILISAAFGIYVRSWGQPLFVILLLIMIPLAVTELGTDSWISDLMTQSMQALGLQGGWVLVYTSAIMVVLRLSAGRIVHRVSPLGLLAISTVIAATGLYFLSYSSGVLILVAATIYGLGKAFFWPTMLGVAAEQFPKGGALTLNITGGTGMIGAGVIGAAVLGFMQDKTVDRQIAEYDRLHGTQVYNTYVTEERRSIFGDYRAINFPVFASAPADDKAIVAGIQEVSKKTALRYIVIFPVVMLLSYLALMAWFKRKGGYRAVRLEAPASTTPAAGPIY